MRTLFHRDLTYMKFMNLPMKLHMKTAMKCHGLLSHEISWMLGRALVMKFHAMKFPMKIS